MKWNYGKSWEEYPIKPRETWMLGDTNLVSCWDILWGTNPFILKQKIDMVYSDPPWNTGNVNSFYTKAGQPNTRVSFDNFIESFLLTLKEIKPRVIFLEMGKQEVKHLIALLHKQYPKKVIQSWEITYYRKNPMMLVRVGSIPTEVNYTGIDDDFTPGIAMEAEKAKNVYDLCTGRGLTGRAAYKIGIPFFGTELNKRRLSNYIEWFVKKTGARVQKVT